MTTRGQKRSGSQPASAAPLQGALREEGENEQTTIMRMVMEKLEAIERQNRLQAAAVESLTKAHAEEITKLQREWQARMAEEKAATTQAMQANFEKFQRIIEKHQADPATRNEMIRLEMRRAKEQAAQQEADFKAALETMPRGTLQNDEGQYVPMIINGALRWIVPGVNKDVPKVYIEEWNKRKGVKAWAAEVKKAITPPEQGLDANKLNLSLGLPPLWDAEVGKL